MITELRELVNYHPKKVLKYYTPELEDLFIGYECEIYQPSRKMVPGIPGSWEAKKLSSIDNMKNAKIRTRCLTKEQIEAEGWAADDSVGVAGLFRKGDNSLTFKWTSLDLEIIKPFYFQDAPTMYKTVYWGACPSINEFRKLMKLLNI